MMPKIHFVILFVFLSSCAKVRIKDSQWCGDLGESGAACFNTLSDNYREISKNEWDQKRVGMICTKPQTFADWKAAIINLCNSTKRCTYSDKRILFHFIDNVEYIEKITPTVFDN
jgi:hypothetical protein